MGPSTAYWSTNLYRVAAEEPRPSAPQQDLPAAGAARFRALRGGLRGTRGVVEHLRFMGPRWRWAWEYTFINRKLCWLHVMKTGLSVTFTVTGPEERRAFENARLATAIATSLRNGHRTGPVRWCWLDLGDRRTVDAFLGFARRKVQWMREDIPPSQLRRSAAG